MANKNKPTAAPAAEQPGQTQELLSIDTLREKHKITRPVFAGVCAANGWKPGRAMTEEAFLQAIADFTKAPMSGAPGKEGSHA